MNDVIELFLRTVLIGTGATALMDLWAALLRTFGVRSLDFALLGRWLGHVPDGQLRHASIAQATPIPGERVIGWLAHYTIGISLAALLMAIFGLGWARAPSLGPALLVGITTVVMPLFVLQPALGLGIASSKTKTPVRNALKSVATHTIFGFGLYAAARVSGSLL